jgi:hypothetical protein
MSRCYGTRPPNQSLVRDLREGIPLSECSCCAAKLARAINSVVPQQLRPWHFAAWDGCRGLDRRGSNEGDCARGMAPDRTICRPPGESVQGGTGQIWWYVLAAPLARHRCHNRGSSKLLGRDAGQPVMASG